MTADDSHECPHHHHSRRKRLLSAAALGLVLLILLSILITWAILHPSEPAFILQDASVYAFNLTDFPALLTTNIQLTVASRNPNARVGIYYDSLRVYAAYRGQQITIPSLIPPSYQGRKDVAVWSPFVYGNSVPVAPYVAAALGRDLNAGTAVIEIVLNGRMRWRVGGLVSGRYHLNVKCPAFVSFGGNIPNTIVVGSTMKYRLIQKCHVDV